MLCGLADGLDALLAHGVSAQRVILIGGGAASEAVRRIAPQVFGRPVLAPPPGEYVADGAARQAAWVALGGDEPPAWAVGQGQWYEAAPVPAIRERYAAARDQFVNRSG
jgi:xylulokinase